MKIRSATTINGEERFDKALKLFKKGLTTLVVIASNGKYLGIVTDRSTNTLQHQPDAKIAALAERAPTLTDNMTIDDISQRFSSGYRELPVFDHDVLIGTVHHTDVLDYLLREGKVPKMRVTEIMSTPLVSIEASESVAKAAGMMRKEGIHHLVIMDKGKFLDIISMADLQPYLEKSKERAPFVREKTGMDTIQLRVIVPSEPEVYKIRQNAHLNEAAQQMMEKNVFTLLVYDGKPKGLVHSLDIIRSSIKEEAPPVEIVGLEGELLEYRDDIRKEVSNSLEKLGKIMPIEGARLTVKVHSKTGDRHKYGLRLMLAGKKTLETSSFGWKFFNALHDVLDEMKKRVMKTKDMLKGKKSGLAKLRRLSVKKRSEDFYPGEPFK